MKKLNHIGYSAEIAVAERTGKKVTALCGFKHHPIASFADRDTCTPCVEKALAIKPDVLADFFRGQRK